MKFINLKWLFIFSIPLLLIYPIQTVGKTEMFNMSYVYFGNPSTYVDQVNNTKGSLQVVSPNYFDINEDGELVITWKLQTSFINEMKKRGIRVVPFLANHWNANAGINGLNNREKLAKDIANAIEKYNLDGVNVDIEGVGHAYRDAHTDFVRLLRLHIPKNKDVAVAVAANPRGIKTGWHGFYDYIGLSNHADYLMIMAYDESWESPESPIGPVSSITFFKNSIKYALKEGVPRDKIVNGLPFYGRMWKLDGPTLSGTSIHGRGLSSTRVGPLVKEFNGIVKFDDKTQSSYANFTIPKGKNAILGTLELTEGDYVIWFENDRSIKAKLRIPGKYEIRGTGSWALFHETPDTWDYYTRWLNGKYFVDVNPTNWSADHIMNISTRGWMLGTSSTSFSPDDNLTRAQGAVILIRALGYENVEPKERLFYDMEKHWARSEIELARELRIVKGISTNSFGPNDLLTREQLATILQNIFQFSLDKSQEIPFNDVPKKRWSYESVAAINQKDYLNGFGDGTFRPQAVSTRAQMAALMDRMALDFENKRSK